MAKTTGIVVLTSVVSASVGILGYQKYLETQRKTLPPPPPIPLPPPQQQNRPQFQSSIPPNVLSNPNFKYGITG